MTVSRVTLFSVSLCALFALVTVAAALPPVPAQQYRAAGEAVTPAPDGTYFCEAEEFTVEKPGWQAKLWGENYYAATFANTFLSRKAFLGAPEDCDETVASVAVDVKEPGKYLVLARYEAPYRFETQFRIKVEQNGKVVLDRLYGARSNLKIWAWGEKLKTEVAWPWGAVENIVWEGHDAYADLQPGLAKITLTAGHQPAPQAKRNVDLIMLTKDEAQVKMRIEKEGNVPLDGWLTQAGDVWMKVTNAGQAKVTVKSLEFPGGPFQQHSSYWVHLRNWKSVDVAIDPGTTSGWIEVGSTMDTLNDGQWGFNTSGPCTIAFGVKNAKGEIEQIKDYAANGNLPLVGFADTRYSKKIQTGSEAISDLLSYLKTIPMFGKTPTQTTIIAGTNIPQFRELYGLREVRPIVSLGDEISLPAPDAKTASEGFAAYLKTRGVQPSQINPAAGNDWTKVSYNPDPKLKASSPGQYYWSQRFLHDYGIQAEKKQTDEKQQAMPTAEIGANFSPHAGMYRHAYLGEVFQWVNCFREGGLHMPWSEDYAWQLPIGTPQMNGICLDLFRAGLRGKPDAKIMYYVMPHMPGNTPTMWRRMFYNALGHGMKNINLFEFEPVWIAYTENHVTGNEMYGMVLKTFREYGQYEDIIQSGQVRQGQVGLWFSETGDIWDDNAGSFAAAKRALYIAILNQQVPLDFIVEQDALDGTLNQYKALFLTDNHVSQAASKKIADWVKNGGRLIATAGAGMFDEYNQPNTVMRKLLGVELKKLIAPEDSKVEYIKQDLPFVKPVEPVKGVQVSPGASDLKLLAGDMQVGKPAAGETPAPPFLWVGMPANFPVYGLVSQVTVGKGARVIGRFAADIANAEPAVVVNATGKGKSVYCAFLPGLSFFKPAIPLKPLDRGSTDDAMSHFLPTNFDRDVANLLGLSLPAIDRPVIAYEPCVEATVIESKAGTVITLDNWSGKPVKGLKVVVSIPVPTKAVALATGGDVRVEKLNAKQTAFTFDLDIADALILR